MKVEGYNMFFQQDEKCETRLISIVSKPITM